MKKVIELVVAYFLAQVLLEVEVFQIGINNGIKNGTK